MKLALLTVCYYLFEIIHYLIIVFSIPFIIFVALVEYMEEISEKIRIIIKKLKDNRK